MILKLHREVVFDPGKRKSLELKEKIIAIKTKGLLCRFSFQ
jgi:hypothetical protein